jgi:hypothetical protein
MSVGRTKEASDYFSEASPPYNRQRQPPLPLQCIPLFQDFAQFLSTPYGHGYTGVSTP